jgi:hypothetical protein
MGGGTELVWFRGSFISEVQVNGGVCLGGVGWILFHVNIRVGWSTIGLRDGNCIRWQQANRGSLGGCGTWKRDESCHGRDGYSDRDQETALQKSPPAPGDAEEIDRNGNSR